MDLVTVAHRIDGVMVDGAVQNASTQMLEQFFWGKKVVCLKLGIGVNQK